MTKLKSRIRVRPVYAVLASALASAVPAIASAAEWSPLGFAQLTAEAIDDADGIDFGADRVRAGARFTAGDFGGALVLDFNVSDAGDRTPGTLTNVVKDVFIDWRFRPGWKARVGQFKTPLGMDFNVPGSALDITKRGMERALVLERDPGAMLSARGLAAGLGFDLGVFNPAGRSAATAHTGAQEGESNAYVGRVLWDHDDLHAELAYGVSEEAGGPDTEDYAALDIGLRFQRDALTLKAEWLDGSDILGVSGQDERVVYAHAGYRLSPAVGLVLRHYDTRSDDAAGVETDLGNTYLGVNFYPSVDASLQMRVQINAVLESGDGTNFGGLADGGRFRDDGVLVQLQVAYP